MTIKHKIVVGLGDIELVSFQCDKCTYQVTMPPDDIKGIPYGCPYGHIWQHGEHEVIHAEPLTYLFAGLAKLRLLTSQKSIGFHILLEFEEPKAG